MLKSRFLHPEILKALGRASHSSKILVADGNYPFATQRTECSIGFA
jgi:L-fucose mutarotase